MKMAEELKIGGQLGLDIRNGKIAKSGSTRRIQELNGLLHGTRPSIDIQRIRAFTRIYKETEGEPELVRRYKAMAEVYRTLEPVIYDHERLAGWATNKIRATQLVLELHAHWIGDDLNQIETRPYDPFMIPEEYKKEIQEVHIPYWKDKTLTALLAKRLPEREVNLTTTDGGTVAINNYLTNLGSHFLPDYWFVLENGFGKYYEIAQDALAGLDVNDPESIDKRGFYNGISDVCLGIKQFAENYANAAAKKAVQEKDPVRKKELLDMETMMRQVPWNPPRNFYEAIEVVWLVMLFQYVEGSGASGTIGRFDQFMYPYYKQGIADGTLTPERAMEFIEELYIKLTANPWLVPTLVSLVLGGYFRYAHLDVGGLNEHRRDATNELSYLCLRAMRHVKTNSPTVSILLHQKTPDSLLYEACKLSAEGMGHPSYFNCETMYEMLNARSGGPTGKSPYTTEQILKYGGPIGCVEPGVAGHQYGHTDSAIINLAQCGTLAITNGVKGSRTMGYGAGTVITCETGDATKFASFEDYYAAVKAQIAYAVKQGHASLIVAEKIISEKFALPTYTMLCRDAVLKGKDCTQGGAFCNIGPTIQSLGFGTLVDSLAAVKKVVFDEKKATMAQLKAAIEANFQGYEELRARLMRAPKYGNNDDYADNIAVDIWEFFANEVRLLKMYLGHYCDPAVQMVQVNVGAGFFTDATANGRLEFTPLSDTMSASQQADTHGPTAAAQSYGKLNCAAYTNGTLLNMWVSRSELIEEAK